MNRSAASTGFRVLVVTILSVFLVLPAAYGAGQSAKLDGKTVFEQKCLKCHKPEKFRSQRNDAKGWELILSRMERNSCVMSEPERAAIAEYLGKNYGE